MRDSSRKPGSLHGPRRSHASIGRRLRQAAAALSFTATLTFAAGFGHAEPAFDIPIESAVVAILPATIEAGKTPGSLSVTSSGAAGYTIPLWTPPGVGSVDLKLALQYSSRGGNGVLGQGWSLSGLSVIETCNGTVAQDGAPGPLVQNAMKRLCLDGQQLKLVSGSYGAVGAVYATEIESFVRIAQVSNGQMSAFIVTTRNGLIYEYGTTEDSQVYGQSGRRHAWALARIRDRQSPTPNQINITYQNDAQYDFYNNGSNIGSYRVLRITYPTTASGQGPYYQVDFAYSQRPTADAFLGYVAGSFIREPNELDSVTIRPYGSTSVIKSYNLAYDASPATGRLRLASVTECSATTCLRPTYVTYQAGSTAFLAMAKASASATGPSSPMPIDLNGDGLQDLVYPKASGSSNSRWWVVFANASGFGSALDTGITTANGNRIIAGQFSGRGVNQLLMAQNGYWNVVTLSGFGFTSVSTGVPVNGEFGAVDWDGDGLPDLASVVGTELRVRRNITAPPGAVAFDTAQFVATTSVNGYLAYNSGSTMTSQADFNADGRGDLTASYFDVDMSVATVVLLSNGFAETPARGSLAGMVDTSRLADFNADGCTDIVTVNTAYASACDGTFRIISSGPVPSLPGAQLVADVDGDGKADVLYVHSSQKTWYVMRSRGDSYAAPVSLGISAPNGTSWFVLDQNGDGLTDLGYRDDSNGGALKYHLHNSIASPADAAVSFTDGLGIAQAVAYVPISRSNYQRHADAVFPEIDVQMPLYVVSEVTADTGTTTDYRLQYYYYGARMHLQGRGFEGFGAVRTYDSRTGLYRMDALQRAFPYTGMVTQSTVLQSNLSTRVIDTSTTLAVQTLGSVPYQQRYFPSVQSSTESRYEFGGALNGTLISRSVSTFTYGDGYGNLTAATRTVTDKDPGSPFLNTSWQTALVASYYNDSSTHCLGMPANTSTTRTAPGKAAMTRTQAYLADLTACRITQQISEPAAPELKVTTAIGYDNCGNPSQLAVTGADWDGRALPVRTSRIDYGARCQLPESVTNPLGEVDTIVYRYDFGVPTARSDANGATTRWTYDTFGRRTGETRPDLTTTTWSFDSCATSTCMGAPYLRFHSRQVSTGTLGTVFEQLDAYFDGADRLRSRTYVRPLGVSTTERYNFDRMGRLILRNAPASGNANNGYRTWTYDALGRVLAEKLYNSSGALDRSVNTTYSGRTLSVTDPLGRTRSVISDVTGKGRQVIEPAPGGVTSYDYDSSGNLARIQDPSGAVSSGSSNSLGFLTDWTDADTGAWTYKRNSFGNLLRWTDAKGQMFTATYDALGRMTSRSEAEGQSLWTWGTSSALHNIGSLQRAAGLGYAEDYSYDGLGRLSRRTISTDQAYLYDYTYGSEGSVDTVTYPAAPIPSGQTGARFKLRYAYSYGGLVSIADVTEPAQKTLWALTAANDFGTATSESVNAGTTSVTSAYRPWTNELIGRQVGKAPSTTDRQNLSFEYDTAGNLTQRRDLAQSSTEVFSHDALNRLTGSTLNGVPNLAIGYDAAGNITSKSDVGVYAYTDPAHPHAVTTAGPKSYSYDANGNQKTRDGVPQSWASFNLPTTLAQTINGTTWQTKFNYGPTHERWKQTATYANGTETTQYLGGLLEKESTTSTGKTYWRHYVPTPSGFIVVSRNSDATSTTHFAATDHLGSTSTVVTAAGDVHAKASYTPFGARRGSDWSATTAPDWLGIANSTRHGYTGHEHLDNVNLVHMGGRVYDPVAARFISADPVIGSLADSQSINPYAYVGNRPLSATDPSGFDAAVPPWVVVGGSSLENTFVAVVTYYALFKNGPVHYPPATVIRGQSAQNGTGICAAGSASLGCGGVLISISSRAGRSAPSSTWEVQAEAEAQAREVENLEQFFIDLGRNAIDEIILAPVHDAHSAVEAYDSGSYGLAVVYVAFTVCDLGCKEVSVPFKSLMRTARKVKAVAKTNTAVSEMRFTHAGETFIRYESANTAFSRVTASGGVTPGTFAAPASDGLVPEAKRISTYNLPSTNIARPKAVHLEPPAGTPIVGPRTVAGGSGNEVFFPYGF